MHPVCNFVGIANYRSGGKSGVMCSQTAWREEFWHNSCQNKGICKVKSEDGSERKRKPHLAYLCMESGIWDVGIRQCAHMRYQTAALVLETINKFSH